MPHRLVCLRLVYLLPLCVAPVGGMPGASYCGYAQVGPGHTPYRREVMVLRAAEFQYRVPVRGQQRLGAMGRPTCAYPQ